MHYVFARLSAALHDLDYAKILQIPYSKTKSFCKHKSSWSTNKHTRKKNINFTTRSLCLTTLLTISPHENGDPSGNWICIQMSKRKHVSHCQRKNCHAKERELALTVHLQLRWWQASWSQFAQCFYDKIGHFFCRLSGSVAWRQCAQLPQLVS